jgi:RNA polymerase nonessential primary-like sigma factor
MRRVIATLDEREQNVIRLRYGLDDGQPRTLDQIGKRFGLSRERVRQIEREVMSKLREGDRASRLKAYAAS